MTGRKTSTGEALDLQALAMRGQPSQETLRIVANLCNGPLLKTSWFGRVHTRWFALEPDPLDSNGAWRFAWYESQGDLDCAMAPRGAIPCRQISYC